MSNLDHAPMPVRATDADREQVLQQLRDGYASGALALDELVERVERTLVAPSTRDLALLSGDIAVSRPVANSRKRIRGILGSNSIGGRWRMAAGARIQALFGTCKVDLSEVELDASNADVVEIDTTVWFGTVKVAVPRGIRVEVEGSPVFGSHKVAVTGRPVDGVPTIRIRARTRFGTLKVRGKGDGLTYW